ncbi:MAG: hypothetical protein OXB93_03865 [Cytophagales bacterium]|nr:hypothetical protein [Cytophagales bacterium]
MRGLALCIGSVGFFVFVSCDLSSLWEKEWGVAGKYQGAWSLPLGQVQMGMDTLWAILATDDLEVVEKENGELIYTYEWEDSKDIMEDLIEIPDLERTYTYTQNELVDYDTERLITSGSGPIEISHDREFMVPFPPREGDQLDYLVYHTGTLRFAWINSFSSEVQLILRISSLQFEGNNFEWVKVFTPEDRRGVNLFSLRGYRLDLVSPDGGTPEFEVEINLSFVLRKSGDQIERGDALRITSGIRDVEVECYHGYFKPREVFLKNGSARIFAERSNLDYGQISLGAPKFFIEVANSQGLPMSLVTEKVAFIDVAQEKYPLEYEGSSFIDYPSIEVEGETKITVLEIDDENSNLSEILGESGGYVLSFPLHVNINPPPPEKQDNNNYVCRGRPIQMHVEMELPLQIKLDDFEHEVSVPIELGNQADQLDGIEEGRVLLRLMSNNGYPFGGALRLIFKDKDLRILHKTEDKVLFESAKTDENGKVTQTTEAIHDLILDSEGIDALLESETITVLIIANTPTNEKGEKIHVRLSRDQTMWIHVGLEVDLDYNI